MKNYSTLVIMFLKAVMGVWGIEKVFVPKLHEASVPVLMF